MNSFYSPGFNEHSGELPPDELRHALRSLRLQKGDNIELLNGLGSIFAAEVTEVTDKGLKLEIRGIRTVEKKLPLLNIAISPIKHTDRFERFVEKATELGVNSITPLICHRTERRKVRAERLQKIMVSALKQSGNPHLPVLHNEVEFDEFVASDNSETKLMAHCAVPGEKLIQGIALGNSVTALIGPEGDFEEREIDTAKRAGFQEVSLGRTILRTETAGMAICAYFHVTGQ